MFVFDQVENKLIASKEGIKKLYVSSGKNNLLFGLKTENFPTQNDDNREKIERLLRSNLPQLVILFYTRCKQLVSRQSSFIIQALMHALGSIHIVYMYVKMIIRILKAHQSTSNHVAAYAAHGPWSPLT